MKFNIWKYCVALLVSSRLMLGAAGDIAVSYNPSGNAWSQKVFAKVNSALLATDSSGVPTIITASAALDLVGSTRGSVLYRGASGWAILVPGTVNHSLLSGGAGADPAYAAIVNSVAGTAGQVTVSGATGAVTISLPATLTFSPTFTASGATLTVNDSASSAATVRFQHNGGTEASIDATATTLDIVDGGGTQIRFYVGGGGVGNQVLNLSSTGNTATTYGGRIAKITNDTSTSLTLDASHHYVTLSNASAVTLSLPALASHQGRVYHIKNVGAGTVTIDPNSTENLFTTTTVATYDLATGAAVEIIAMPSWWAIMSRTATY